MSCSLYYRRTPEDSDWDGNFKCHIRDAIDKRCRNLATYQDVDFFKGMVVIADLDDKKDLQRIIDIIEDGGTVDFKMEF